MTDISAMNDDLAARVNTLEQQQSLLTQALASALQGQWTGAPPSVEAYLYAINPNLTGTLVLDPPVVAT